jgi:hypothetical protein
MGGKGKEGAYTWRSDPDRLVLTWAEAGACGTITSLEPWRLTPRFPKQKESVCVCGGGGGGGAGEGEGGTHRHLRWQC